VNQDVVKVLLKQIAYYNDEDVPGGASATFYNKS
jgi:hypothetical protein